MGKPGEKPEDWEFVSKEAMKLEEYPCGVRVGQILRLCRDLHFQNHKGVPTGEVRRAGDQSMVLTGNPKEPQVVWLRWKDGKVQTWDEFILDWFEPMGKEGP